MVWFKFERSRGSNYTNPKFFTPGKRLEMKEYAHVLY